MSLRDIGHKGKNFFLSLCTILGAMMLICLFGIIMLDLFGTPRVEVKDNSCLSIDFSANYTETPADDLFSEFWDEPQMTLFKMLQSIELAADDDKITCLVARIDKSRLDASQIQDVARAISVFKDSGKKTYVFSQGFGEMGQGNLEYYLASFFDEIYMQPQTDIGLTGISIEVPFLKDVLDKIGVTPEFYSRYEFKNAMDSLTDKTMSQAYKTELQQLAQNFMNELKLDITQNRQLKDSFENIVNKAPLSAAEGLNLNLIDGIMYLQELEQKLKEQGVKHFINISDYASLIRPNSGELPTIAVLNLNGVITSDGNSNDLSGEVSIRAKDILEEIKEIEELPQLNAVILRINSPGGSYHAADEIYFALQHFKKEKNVPIIVSQSSYAASGGYFLSLAGDYIIAEPMTITGSIGVVGGKMVFGGLWKKLGINWENIKIGANADILSMNKMFSPSEKRIFDASLDNIYQDFTQKVQENRKLTRNIDEIARGRVWSGRQALELGLVDALGGWDEAIYVAKEKGRIGENDTFKLLSYPQAKSWREKISDILFVSDSTKIEKFLMQKSGVNVDITYLKLFKRLQYDTVLLPFKINM